MSKHVVASVMLSLAIAGMPAVAAASPKYGCPAVASGAEEKTVQEAAEFIYPKLLDDPYGSEGALADVLETYNRNGDDSVCVLTRWGAHLNEKSHWYRVGIEAIGEPVTLLILFDNNANARK